MTSLQQVNFYQLVQVVMKVERLETSNKERSHKKNFSRGALSSSRKRARESPAQSEYRSSTRGRRQGSNAAPNSGKGASVGHGEIPECPHCHKRHLGLQVIGMRVFQMWKHWSFDSIVSQRVMG